MANALKWSAVDRTLQQGVQFIIGIVLARLLSPSDYGLIGMIMVFAQIAYVMVESGLGSALVRTKDYTETHANTVFFTNLGLSLILYAALFFTAPYIAIFFNQPSLTHISRVMFTAILFNAFYIVPFNLCVKSMDYKTIAKVNLASTIMSGASGIGMALYGMGVWALVAQQTSYHAFRLLFFYIFSRWMPRFEYSVQILKGYISFSIHILGSSMLTVIFNNLYTFLIGKFYNIDKVGFYSQANKMSDTVNFTFQAILNSTYSMFAKIHTQIERVSRILRSLIQKISIINVPLTLFLIVAAEPIFFILLGEKWLGAVRYFQIICAANLFSPIYFVNIHAINAIGKSRVTFLIELVKRLLILSSVAICLVNKSEISTMLCFYALCCWVSFFISMCSIKKRFGVTLLQMFSDFKDGVVVAIFIAIICILSDHYIDNIIISFLVQAFAAAGLYGGYIMLFKKELIAEIKAMIHGNYD